MDKLVGQLLGDGGVHCFGVCRFEDCLPLLPCRAAARIPRDARSVIVCLFPYYTGEYPERNVARYAVPPDYHGVAGGILQALADSLAAAYPGETFVPFVDSSPIREVEAARLAGLGDVGGSGLLVSAAHGVHVFIGCVVTTAELPPGPTPGGRCAECGRCVETCPTGALSPGRPLQKERCRSFITQKKGGLTPWEEGQVRAGGLAWGCDRCVDACPRNTRMPTPIRAFFDSPAPVLTPENLERLLAEKAYGYRGRAVLERNLQLINRS